MSSSIPAAPRSIKSSHLSSESNTLSAESSCHVGSEEKGEKGKEEKKDEQEVEASLCDLPSPTHFSSIVI